MHLAMGSSYSNLLLETTLFPRTGMSLDKRSLCECMLDEGTDGAPTLKFKKEQKEL